MRFLRLQELQLASETAAVRSRLRYDQARTSVDR